MHHVQLYFCNRNRHPRVKVNVDLIFSISSLKGFDLSTDGSAFVQVIRIECRPWGRPRVAWPVASASAARSPGPPNRPLRTSPPPWPIGPPSCQPILAHLSWPAKSDGSQRPYRIEQVRAYLFSIIINSHTHTPTHTHKCCPPST